MIPPIGYSIDDYDLDNQIDRDYLPNEVLKNNSPTITPQERQRRLTAWEQSLANFALEDIHPTEEMTRIGFMYINGEITLEEQSKMMRMSILNN